MNTDTISKVIDLVNRHKMTGFAKIMFARFSPIEKFRYLRAVKEGKVYLGEHLSARQGVQERLTVLERLITYYSKSHSTQFVNILEVGSYAGASSIVWSKGIKKYFNGNGMLLCVDPWDSFAEIDTMKNVPTINKRMDEGLKSGRVFELFLHNIKAAGGADVTKYKKGCFDGIFDQIKDQKFDIIFIDGDHRYKSVITDLELSSQILKDGGILCGDDLEVQWPDVDQELCQKNQLSDFIFDSRKAKTHFHPGVTQGVFDFFHKRVSCWIGTWAMQKSGSLWNEIEFK